MEQPLILMLRRPEVDPICLNTPGLGGCVQSAVTVMCNPTLTPLHMDDLMDEEHPAIITLQHQCLNEFSVGGVSCV